MEAVRLVALLSVLLYSLTARPSRVFLFSRVIAEIAALWRIGRAAAARGWSYN